MSTVTKNPPANIKSVHAANNTQVHRNSKTPYMVGGIVVALIVIFILAVVIFIILFEDVLVHNIRVVNNCTDPMNVLLVSQGKSLPTTIPVNGTYQYAITPGFSGYLTATVGPNTILCNDVVCPNTQVVLNMADDSSGQVQMVNQNGSFIKLELPDPVYPQDTYGVSVQQGYNIPMTIAATSNFTGSATGFNCTGPVWANTIPQTTCPTELQILDSGGNYLSCASACDAGLEGQDDTTDYCCTRFNCNTTSTTNPTCETLWAEQSYFTTFDDACPNCLITNCDQPNYTCSSTGNELSTYTITLCPAVTNT